MKLLAAILVVLAILGGMFIASTTEADAHYLPNRECIEYYPWNEIKRVYLYEVSNKTWYWITWANVSTGYTHKDTCFEFSA